MAALCDLCVLCGEIVVCFVDSSPKESVNAIREARGRRLSINGETLHNYVSFTAEDYKKPDGPKCHTSPSLKSEADRLALFGAEAIAVRRRRNRA